MFGTNTDAIAMGASHGNALAEQLLNGTDFSLPGKAAEVMSAAMADINAHVAEFQKSISAGLVKAWSDTATGAFTVRWKIQRRLVP
jgi:hypothetical protein